MKYEERIRLIAAKLNGFLRDFKAPDHLDEAGRMARIRKMADAANKRLSASCTPEDLAARVDEVLTQIAESYRGQSWPMPADVAKAFDALPKREQKPDDLLEWARRAWFHGNPDTGLLSGSVVPGATSWEIAKRLIDEGADPWALRYAGFETEIGYYRDLEARGHGWSGHAAKMAELAESAACFGAPQ